MRWNTRNSSAIGMVITIEAAITPPQSVLNSVENSDSPMGSVFTEESLAKQSAKMNSFHVVTKAKTTIDTIPGVADVYLGDVDTSKFSNFGSKPSVSPATLIDSLLVKVTASSHVAITNMTKTSLTFSPSDISNGNYRTASTHDTLTSTVASLLGNTAYKIKILIVTIGTQSSIQQALSAVMTSITAPLDTLLDNILMTLGVRIGEADVRVTDVRCQQPVLVQ